jgi:uncharacterized protein YyaL (SSP411 family)
MTAPHSPNRLAAEPSLYLRQHGTNPVDWYPWGSEALERARSENKPILLSIGYSACHWCHVMERESFEDPEIAALMNERFVPIKVDREERPDVDAIYMKCVQMMTGRGGWPMTVFLTPGLEPFYAGTYFPPDDRGGMPGFRRVLAGVARAFEEQPDKVAESAAKIVAHLGELERAGKQRVNLDEQALVGAAERLAGAMDPDYGGFGQAPKFPGSLCLSFLMGIEAEWPDERRRGLVRTALDRMADGGIYDHLGGGFHRYSVDRYWLVPHFEKMLYDEALLAGTYVEAWLAYGDERYREVATGILEYVGREMTSPEGAFYATQDADSEGVEGKYFVWTPAEVADVVGADDAELVCRFFDVSLDGNFEGANILHRTLGFDEAARLFERTAAAVEASIHGAVAALFERRLTRIPPATDTKVLADWNGLMIATMARAGRALERADFVERAAAAADFVRAHMWRGDRLLHFYSGGEARVPAFLDDYAFFGRGCFELFVALGRREDIESACESAAVLLGAFEDSERGGFYSTSADAEDLIVRGRELYDGPIPSGNSVAAELLLQLHQLTGEDAYRRVGEGVLEAFFAEASANPYGGANLLAAAHRYRRGYTTVVIVGGDETAAGELARAARIVHAPAASVIALPGPGVQKWLPGALRGKKAVGGRPAAYLCRGSTCSPPVTHASELRALLEQHT